jgi:polar amino acid transport system permease protein
MSEGTIAMGAILDFVTRYGPEFLIGLGYTLYISMLGSAIGIALGFVVALLRGLPILPLQWLCRTYIEVLRGTPVLIQLFIIYYVGPGFGLTLSAVTVGIFGLGIYGGAYFAEIFRSGFLSIPKGQIEAARMVGLSSAQILRKIKVPQMLVLIIPPAINQIIILVKESAVLSIITVPELTKVTTQIVNESFAIVGPYLVMALLYWGIIEATSRLGMQLERKLARYL